MRGFFLFFINWISAGSGSFAVRVYVFKMAARVVGM